jgi:hypothetical protein
VELQVLFVLDALLYGENFAQGISRTCCVALSMLATAFIGKLKELLRTIFIIGRNIVFKEGTQVVMHPALTSEIGGQRYAGAV